VIVDERGVESALRAFKRLVLRDGILREVKRKKSYEKPGERKRRKVREAARRRRRQQTRALRRKDDRP
ncbi:MAG: 30S ribosomal protein S21, partial [Candidatus Methylomirabilales bacterium]